MFRRALRIRERTFGPAHVEVAGALSNLAEHYRAQARYRGAEPLHRRAIAIVDQALGPENPVVVVGLWNSAALLRDVGREAEASALQDRARAIRARLQRGSTSAG